MDTIQKQLDDLKKEIELLKTRRVSQADILPDSVKMRAIAEGVRYLRDGVTANKPTRGEVPMQGAAVYYDRTTKKLYIWNNDNNAWDMVQLS